MRQILFAFLVVAASACTVGNNDGGGGGDDGGGDDVTPDAPASQATCSMPETVADAGDLTALKAQQCNVPGSQGAQKWYRLSATLPGSTAVVQVDLWDGRGAFAAGAVAIGTYPISGAELSYETCGLCVRALGDKGGATEKEYFATGGSVEITAIGADGAPISATLTDIAFAEVDGATHAAVTGGCSASLARAKVDGTVAAAGNGGGGGGGGGGNCPSTVGD